MGSGSISHAKASILSTELLPWPIKTLLSPRRSTMDYKVFCFFVFLFEKVFAFQTLEIEVI